LTAAYDLTEIHEDLLKELYQELVDPQTRHDLGEFYTPDWLAELTLREAGFPPSPGAADDSASLLDPACGSGTFLFTAVRLLRESGLRGRSLVDFCAERLAGVDVHPLAVTIAKTNLLLALGEDLRGGARRFGLPIYMADTLSARAATTKPDPVRDALAVPVDVDTIADRSGKKKGKLSSTMFEIPVVLARRPALLSDLLDALLRFADPTIGEKDAWTGFQKRLRDLGASTHHDHYWSRNLGLMRWLLQPPATDTVWRFILRNACQPQLLSERKFAFVVGNPPWLSYRYIARPDYQTRVRELVFFYELLDRKQSHLFTQMELATLFFAFCADLYLGDAGTLAFVMPRSILTGAKQHGNFRNRYVASARLLLDCEQVAPLFNVPACVVIWHKRVGTDGPLAEAADSRIPMIRLRGDLPSRNASYAETTDRLVPSETTYTPPTAAGRSPYFDEVTQGATIVPRCLWFVRPPESARTIDRRQPQLETDTATERQAKMPWKGIRLSGSVEADFLYATLLSDHMVPFGWRRLSLVVLPLIEGPDRQMSLLDEAAAIREGKPGLADWLRSAAKLWGKHGKSSQRVRSVYDRLDFSQCLTRQRPKGVVKLLYNTSGTHLCACVVDTTTINDWSIHGLPVRGVLSQHTTYWLETQDVREAHYLCAILNAPGVDHAIKVFQPKGAFGAQHGAGERHICRLPFEVLPIPRYSRAEDHHRELARLSQQCHEAVARYLSTADAKVLNMPIGRLRTLIRTDLLKDELAQIDALTARVVSER